MYYSVKLYWALETAVGFDRRGNPKRIIISNSTATTGNIKISGTLKCTGKVSGGGALGYNSAGEQQVITNRLMLI